MAGITFSLEQQPRAVEIATVYREKREWDSQRTWESYQEMSRRNGRQRCTAHKSLREDTAYGYWYCSDCGSLWRQERDIPLGTVRDLGSVPHTGIVLYTHWDGGVWLLGKPDADPETCDRHVYQAFESGLWQCARCRMVTATDDLRDDDVRADGYIWMNGEWVEPVTVPHGKNRPTYKQAVWLRKKGVRQSEIDTMSFDQASGRLTELFGGNRRKSEPEEEPDYEPSTDDSAWLMFDD